MTADRADSSPDTLVPARQLRVLHAAQMRKPEVGVVRQMEYEQSAADELGIPWDSRMFTGKYTDSPIVIPAQAAGWFAFKSSYYQWLHEQAVNYDVIMLRYAKYDPLQWRFVKKCHLPVVTMHHTLEVYELLGNGNLRSRLLAQAERLCGRLTLSQVSAIAGVTRQIGEYQVARSGDPHKPLFHYSNGAVYDDREVIAATPANPDCFEFMFLSSRFPTWLGLDLLFDAAQASEADFKVHVVGGLTDDQRAMLSTDTRFVCHGYLDKPEIDQLMARCTLGLSTFGIHRKRFTEGNTLKAREYLRAGLPVYAGHIDIFEDDFPYHRSGPADFDQILRYASEMQNIDRIIVSEAARPIIEKKRVLAKMYRELCELFDRRNDK